MAIRLEQHAWIIAYKDVVMFRSADKNVQLGAEGDNAGPCFFTAIWTDDQRYAAAVLSGCEGYVKFYAVDSVRGVSTDATKFKGALEAKIRTEYRVPQAESIWKWVRSDDARDQFRAKSPPRWG